MRTLSFVAIASLALALVLPAAVRASPGPSLDGSNVRVSTHDFFADDPYFASTGAPDVFQQNEPSIAVHPTDGNFIAVGMNDVRTLSVSNDAWQTLAVSTDGGATWTESPVPGFPTDGSAAGLASPIRGNRAASDPWVSFDNFGNLFYALIAFQRTPPGRPDFDPQDTNAIAVAKYSVSDSTVSYSKTVVVERGTVGLGRQEDKEALAVDNISTSAHHGNVYVCWARFTGFQDHLKVARSTDHGESYQIANIAAASNMQGCDVAAAPNGNVYVSWRTFDVNPLVSNPQDSAIFVARSTDGGATFGRPVRVAKFVDYRQNTRRDPPIFRTFALTTLAADTSGVYVGWQEKVADVGGRVKVSRSKTNGATWETPVTLGSTTEPGHRIMAALEAAGGKLSAVWYDSRSEPSFTASGPVSGSCPPDATTGAGCLGMDVFYAQADTGANGLSFGAELRLTIQSFNPNLFGSIKAIRPFIGDYIAVAANATTAYVVWADNRDMNPKENALEDTDVTTDQPSLINARSRDANIYFQKVTK